MVKRNDLNYCIVLFAVICTSLAQAQDTAKIQKMGITDFMTIVREHHPIARQAALKAELGEAELLAKKGAFDPYLYGDIGQKYFDDKQYYNLIDAGMKVPTWFGIEMQAGLEQTDGDFINPQRTTPNNGLVYAGISVPIGQDLFIDQRRADLRNAQIYQNITLEERRLLLNKLFKKAVDTYWKWFAASRKYTIYQEALELAQVRFQAVESSARIGELPYVDTVEAYVQLQNRKNLLQSARLNYENITAELEVFLWNQDQQPLTIASNIEPPAPERVINEKSTLELGSQMDTLIKNHPALLKKSLEVSQLEINRKLAVERLKPQLDLKYNAINEPIAGDLIQGYSINNYTWGLTFKMPIFLRKERGQLQKANIQLQEQELALKQLERELSFGLNAAYNSWNTLGQQIQTYQSIVGSSEQLLEAERQKFRNGESSLFLVNSREMRYVKARIEYIDLIRQLQQAYIEVQFRLGQLD